ncbi:MAG: SlyX family protein [Gammaproteobacteria bacterium]|nr:SlyX family protein [Gammaproteobacteria bacterium]
MTNDDLERLELKLAYLERANQELSEVIFRQQREIDDLRARLGAIFNELDAAKSERRGFSAADERPPHY